MGRSTFVVVSLLITIIAPFASAAECKFFTGDKTDADWSYSAKSNDAIWLAGQQHKTPTLFLNKSSIIPGSIVFETDAREMNIACGDAGVITVPVQRRATTSLAFDQSDDRPTLKINGQETPAYRGPWIRMVQDKSEKMVFELVGATFATIHFPTPSLQGAPASGGTNLAGAVDPAAATPIAQLSAQPAASREMLQRARPSVFEIDTFDSVAQPFGSGTGFIVSADGYVATNYHVVRGASSAKALIGTDLKSGAVALELYTVQPEFDLAILKLPVAGKNAAPLPISINDPAEGDDCWAAGYPEGLGYSITKGVVNGIRDFTKFPPELQAAAQKYSRESRWIQTDCTINHGNSGGPLLDSKGEVIGINTWSWTVGHNLYFALSSSHLSKLLKDIPSKPITFAGAAEKYKSDGTDETSITGDLPKLNVASNISAVRLTATATAVPNAIGHRCNECSGTGRISTKVQTGTQSGNGMTAPIFATRTDRCSKCGGTGIERSSDEIIERLADNLVRQIASLDRKDKDYQRALNAAYKCLTEAVIGDSRTWIKLNSDARGIVAQQKLQPRTAIVVRGDFVSSVGDPDGNGQMFYATVSGTNQLVLLRYPVTAEDPKPGASVLMGGLIAGTAETRDKHRIVVVQNGFLVAPVISPDWYWWWTGESRRSIPIR